MQTAPSEEEEANIASLWETINPAMHVTPFLWDCGNCNTCLHCRQRQRKGDMKEFLMELPTENHATKFLKVLRSKSTHSPVKKILRSETTPYSI